MSEDVVRSTFVPILVLTLVFLTRALFSGFEHAGKSVANGDTRSDSVVKISASAQKPDGQGRQVVTVDIAIDPGWHLYANPVPKDFPGVPTTVTVAGFKPEEVKIEYPSGKPVKDPFAGDHNVYEGTVTIKAALKRAPHDTRPVEINVKLQACTQDKCLLPATLNLTVP